jgi:hypothetical protein
LQDAFAARVARKEAESAIKKEKQHGGRGGGQENGALVCEEEGGEGCAGAAVKEKLERGGGEGCAGAAVKEKLERGGASQSEGINVQVQVTSSTQPMSASQVTLLRLHHMCLHSAQH